MFRTVEQPIFRLFELDVAKLRTILQSQSLFPNFFATLFAIKLVARSSVGSTATDDTRLGARNAVISCFNNAIFPMYSIIGINDCHHLGGCNNYRFAREMLDVSCHKIRIVFR